jgi:hypothetical protein
MRRTLLLAVLVAALLGASAAHAGTYEVRVCDAAPGFANNAWVGANDSPATLELAQVCPSAGGQFNGLRAFDELSSPNTPAQSEAAHHIEAPPGTAIAGATLTRWIGKDGSNSWIPFVRADSSVLETCTIPGGEVSCQVGAPGGVTQAYGGLSANRLSIGIRCGQTSPATCSNGGTIHSAWAVLYGGTVTLTDPTPPSVGVDSAGSSLFSGWVKGTQQLRVTASDSQSGVRELQLFDGRDVRVSASVPEAAGGCANPNSGIAYTFTQPCAGARGVNGDRTIVVNTDDWPSGRYQGVFVRALDAGGELGQAGPFTVGVDHDPPANLRFTRLPRRLRVRAGRRITRVAASADDAHSGLATLELEWRDLSRTGSAWRALRVGAEPVARARHRYRFRARAVDRLGNRSADLESPTVLGVRPPRIRASARLADGFLALIARAPRGRRVTLGLRLSQGRSLTALRERVRVRGRVARRIPLRTGFSGVRSATLRIRYRSAGRLRSKQLRVTSRRVRFELPLEGRIGEPSERLPVGWVSACCAVACTRFAIAAGDPATAQRESRSHRQALCSVPDGIVAWAVSGTTRHRRRRDSFVAQAVTRPVGAGVIAFLKSSRGASASRHARRTSVARAWRAPLRRPHPS